MHCIRAYCCYWYYLILFYEYFYKFRYQILPDRIVQDIQISYIFLITFASK